MKSEIKRTVTIAIPIILGNVTQMAIGLIDNAMLGSINSTQLAAASLVNNVLAIPTTFGIGITMAISPLVAIAAGRSDVKTASHYLYNGFILSTIIAVLIGFTVHFSAEILYHLKQDPVVAEYAYDYLILMGYSLIPMVMFLALKQFTDGLEYTRVAMLIALSTIPLNIGFNYLFIFGKLGFPRLEILGAGIGTMLTRIVTFIAMLIIILKSAKFKEYVGIRLETWKIKAKSWQGLLKIGIPSGLQYSMESGAFAFSGIMVGWLGAKELASHQIALSIASFTFMISLGLSSAGSIRTSNALGQENILKIRKIGFGAILTAIVYGVFCGIIFIVFRDKLPYIFNNETDVVILASTLLLWAAVFQISDSAQAIGVGILRGIKDIKVPTLFVGIAYWIIGIPVGYYFAFDRGMGTEGIWLGLVTGLTCSAILLTYRFNKITKKMLLKKNIVEEQV